MLAVRELVSEGSPMDQEPKKFLRAAAHRPRQQVGARADILHEEGTTSAKGEVDGTLDSFVYDGVSADPSARDVTR